MKKITILWADDEIDLLRPNIIFLETKGYEVITATNGHDAVEMVKTHNPDLVFLDEYMPGKSGLEALEEIKGAFPALPVVMITKSEEENIMEEAIGSKISDYLIKPVHPKQILLAIKKNVDTRMLVTKKITSSYQSEFGKLGMSINSASSFGDWVDIYRRIVYWEMELEDSADPGMNEVVALQKQEANNEFARFIKSEYPVWFEDEKNGRPLMSHTLFSSRINPLLDKSRKVAVIVIDNLRYDQWKAIMPDIREYFQVENEELYCSILPTATQFARNAFFGGLMPWDIERLYPQLWVNEEEEGSKNLHEKALLGNQLKRLGRETGFYYEKVLNKTSGKKLSENISSLASYPLTVLVYNFVDMLSHARTEMEVIKELADDDSAYRSLTRSWFRHSYLLDLLRELSRQRVKVFLTSDHGSVKVENPVKVVGDRNTTTNLRYKQGKNLDYDPRQVLEVRNPSKIRLPRNNVSSAYIFATGRDFFVYPNNYNYYANYYRNTFQHGGISLEEMLVPFISLDPRE
ncbi:MAG: PglZ domain-containing protein [Marinilabiliales bacterium]|nr:MAG: PglZ domain-containing protein [Marinilabiliales bacterium]